MSVHIARDAASRMQASVCLIAAQFVESCMGDLRQLATVTDSTLEDASAARQLSHLMDAYGFRSRLDTKPFAFSNGYAVIPVHGTLINRFYGSWGYVTGYNFIRAQLNAALEDDDVKQIILDVNSYGGEAAGCFELAAEIRDARKVKPILAVVDSNCCSAAYALASAATKLVVTPSGQAGSIGVIATHINVGKMMKDFGIEVTIIAEGAHKADGNPYESLSKEVLEEIRDDVKKSYGKFIDLVVLNRPKLDSQAVRGTESRCYKADEALELKLIDAIQTPTEAVASFLAEIGSDEPEDEEDTTLMAMTAEEQAANALAVTNAATAARAEERARVKGITQSAEGVKRPTLANHLAHETDMTVEAATAILAAAPEVVSAAAAPAAPAAAAAPVTTPAAAAPAATGKGALSAAMDGQGGAGVGAESADGEQAADKPSRAQEAMRHIGFSTAAKSGAAAH